MESAVSTASSSLAFRQARTAPPRHGAASASAVASAAAFASVSAAASASVSAVASAAASASVSAAASASLLAPPPTSAATNFSCSQAPSTLRTKLGSTAAADLKPAPELPAPVHPSSPLGFERSSPGQGSSFDHGSSPDHRSMPGMPRSVQVLGGDLVAFGRTILTDVPGRVTVGPCKHHDGPAAADTQGAFIGAREMTSSSRHVFTLGTLRGLRFLSCFRFKLWWMTQRVGHHGREVPFETQFLLLELPPLGPETAPTASGTAHAPEAAHAPGAAHASAGPLARRQASNQAVRDSDTVYVVMLPVLEGAFRSSLQGGLDDRLEACVESGDPSVTSVDAYEAVYVHAGHNPFRTISEAVRAVEAHSGSFTRREMKTMPGLLDHFGWCTWDAFYTDVTAQGVNQGLESLANGGTPAKFLIIDDGWQTVVHDDGPARGQISAGTQYASRLTCVRENQKFKASASLKAARDSEAKAARDSEAKEPQAPSGTQNGIQHNMASTAEASTSGAAAEAGVAAAGAESAALEAARSAAEAAAEAAAAASLAAEETRLAGLGHLVEQVKATHAVKFVYVWHALLGYWGGVNPCPQGGMGRFEPALSYPVPSHGVLANQPDMAEDTLTLNGLGVVAPAKAFHFYDELHSYLAECGVDGVKVDVQNILETLGAGHGGRVALAREYHSALESSVRKNFRDNGIISCMSHNTDALYLAKQTAVMRASDDFWPTDPASHTVHIISVAYNSLFLGEFMQPDWDMFQSLHPAAEFHGAARAAGGCAVYVSDKPQKHDFGVLRKLVLPDGSILRARLPGRPTRDCLFADPARDTKSLLKIWNLNACNGIVAAFNCQGAAWCREGRKYTVHNKEPGTVTGVVSAEDIDALGDVAQPDWEGDVIAYSHFADELVPLPHATNLVVSLPPLQCEVYTMAPVKVLGQVQFAAIGFSRMYNAGGGLLASQFYSRGAEKDRHEGANKEEGRNEKEGEKAAVVGELLTALEGVEHRATLHVRGGGTFLAYSSEEPSVVSCDGRPVGFEFCNGDGRLLLELPFNEKPICIDIDFKKCSA